MKTRKIIEVVNKKHLKQPDMDIIYWRDQPYEVRLAALEEIRQEYHRWKDNVQPGLQRVYRIIDANQVRYLVVGGYIVEGVQVNH